MMHGSHCLDDGIVTCGWPERHEYSDESLPPMGDIFESEVEPVTFHEETLSAAEWWLVTRGECTAYSVAS